MYTTQNITKHQPTRINLKIKFLPALAEQKINYLLTNTCGVRRYYI
jgi:hypothetical protein